MNRLTWTILIAVAVVIVVIFMYEKKLNKAKETAVAGASSDASTTDGSSTEQPTADVNTQASRMFN